jgi:hypothetical protein
VGVAAYIRIKTTRREQLCTGGRFLVFYWSATFLLPIVNYARSVIILRLETDV